MLFEDFAASCGLIIQHVEYGKWCRVPTEDKPKKRNGAYRHLGDVAFVQNHATMAAPETWFPDSDKEIKIDRRHAQQAKARADKELENNRRKAADRADQIIRECVYSRHAYMDRKGFPDAEVLVYKPDTDNLLVVPMRVARALVGVQLIDINGGKKFLYGQRCAGAEYVFDAKGTDIWCEGYATALSIRSALVALKIPHRIHVCFSAGNLASMAMCGIVVADNDESMTGEKAAKSTGLRYFMPPDVGTDFNDYHQSVGTLRAGLALRPLVLDALRKGAG